MLWMTLQRMPLMRLSPQSVTGGEIAKSRFDLVYNPFYFAALSRKKIGLGSKKSHEPASRFILGHLGIGRWIG